MTLQVRRLGLQVGAERHASSIDLEKQLQDLAQVLHLCSPTLYVLRLRLLQTTDFRGYEMDALDPPQLKTILVSLLCLATCTPLLALSCAASHKLCFNIC